MNSYSEWKNGDALNIIESFQQQREQLLPILHKINNYFGYIDQAAIPMISHHLNLSVAEVHGVITFYHDFHDRKQPKNVLKICCGEACQANGAEKLIDEIKKKYNLSFFKTEEKLGLKLIPIYCYGNCVCGPTSMFNEKLISRTTIEKVTKLIEN